MFARRVTCDLPCGHLKVPNVVSSSCRRADDAHWGCHEARESVPPQVEHDSQLAQGGRHVRAAPVFMQRMGFRALLCIMYWKKR